MLIIDLEMHVNRFFYAFSILFLALAIEKMIQKKHINFTFKGIYGKMEHPDADFNNQKVIFEGMY